APNPPRGRLARRRRLSRRRRHALRSDARRPRAVARRDLHAASPGRPAGLRPVRPLHRPGEPPRGGAGQRACRHRRPQRPAPDRPFAPLPRPAGAGLLRHQARGRRQLLGADGQRLRQPPQQFGRAAGVPPRAPRLAERRRRGGADGVPQRPEPGDPLPHRHRPFADAVPDRRRPRHREHPAGGRRLLVRRRVRPLPHPRRRRRARHALPRNAHGRAHHPRPRPLRVAGAGEPGGVRGLRGAPLRRLRGHGGEPGRLAPLRHAGAAALPAGHGPAGRPLPPRAGVRHARRRLDRPRAALPLGGGRHRHRRLQHGGRAPRPGGRARQRRGRPRPRLRRRPPAARLLPGAGPVQARVPDRPRRAGRGGLRPQDRPRGPHGGPRPGEPRPAARRPAGGRAARPLRLPVLHHRERGGGGRGPHRGRQRQQPALQRRPPPDAGGRQRVHAAPRAGVAAGAL
ncbi:MAG: Glycerophosphoryl diester phosphodiesterase, partial [uncultured Acetobacteraceae bacterium]